ncbi:MAG: hypothetical protein ACK4L7_05175 [Flavobacteriales bacterium]
MSINGKRTGIMRADLLAVAKAMNIKKAAAIIDEVKAGVSKWKRFARQAGVNQRQAEAIGRLHLTRL